MSYPKECAFNDVCEPCGEPCKGLPCVREQLWKNESCAKSVEQQIQDTQKRIDERNSQNELDEKSISRLALLYQKLTGQLDMTFDERLERAR